MLGLGVHKKLEEINFKPVGVNMLRLLSLDLGNNLGYSVIECSLADRCNPKWYFDSFDDKCGVLKLVTSGRESWGARFIRFKTFLNKVSPTCIFYEEIRQRFKSNAAACNYGGFVSTLVTWGADNRTDCLALAVGSIKKHATSKGNAGKDLMIEAANSKFGMKLSFDRKDDDNIADALHIMSLGIEHYYGAELVLSQLSAKNRGFKD